MKALTPFPGEPGRALLWLGNYLRMTPPRSMRRLVRDAPRDTNPPDLRRLREWSRKYRWMERTDAYDREVAETQIREARRVAKTEAGRGQRERMELRDDLMEMGKGLKRGIMGVLKSKRWKPKDVAMAVRAFCEVSDVYIRLGEVEAVDPKVEVQQIIMVVLEALDAAGLTKAYTIVHDRTQEVLRKIGYGGAMDPGLDEGDPPAVEGPPAADGD